MKEYILNSTPVRTSNNFGINDVSVKLDDIDSAEFENIMIITSEMDKLEIKNNDLEYQEDNVNYSNNNLSSNILSSKIGLELEKNYELSIIVKKGNILNEPVIINCDFDDENSYLVDNIKIILEEGAMAEFVLKYSGEDEAFHYLKQETTLKENSNAKIIIANMLSKASNSFIAIENIVENNAKIDYTIIDFGGKNKISNYYTNLKGDFSENNLKTIYLGTDEDLIDINYNIEVYGKNAKCNIEVEGAINGKSHKNFKGTIDFKKGCENSKGKENENCMILSDTAKSKSLPMLLCEEENVEGEHGVSSGKIDESKLFYIMAKGISDKDAKKLIVKANFSKIINEINDETLQSKILEIIDNNL